jgi:hypothetical protein
MFTACTSEILDSKSYEEDDPLAQNELKIDYQELFNNFNSELIGSFTINSTFILEKYKICCPELAHGKNMGKAYGHIQMYKQGILLATSGGSFFYVDKNSLDNKNFQFKPISTNFSEVNKNSEIYIPIDETITDIFIHENVLYVSYMNKRKEECLNIEVMRSSNINLDFITFENFLTFEECVEINQNPFARQGGGALAQIDDSHIALTIGDYRQYSLPQNPDSVFGKILKVQTNSGEYEIISLGHRNPQGLTISKDELFLIETEHGPQGGDEVNIIDLANTKNYGWPISSYGFHYNPIYNEEYGDVAPLHKSHEDYGFAEPIIYFDYETNGSHGISTLLPNYFNSDDSYFITTLNGRRLYSLTIENMQVKSNKTYFLNERTRDIIYDEQRNVYYLIFEDTPSFGVLRNNG